MPSEKTPLNPPGPGRFTRWSSAGSSSPYRPYRLVYRVLGIPLIAVLGVYLYKGVRDRLVLPECDSSRARQTLSDVLQQLKLTPLRYEPIKTVSTGKTEVVCNATLPLPDGGDVVIDYSFVWEGDKANMRYSVVREPPPPQPPAPGAAP
jgi:hypothetical protein